MRAYVINMDSAPDRWAAIEKTFAATQITLQRVPGVNGSTLVFPHKNYAEHHYRWFHGRESNPREVGCYLSHIAACQAFLETNDTHGLICEDDITLGSDFERVLADALRHAHRWDILRLTGLTEGVPLAVRRLTTGHRLCVSLGRLKGAGAYVVDRKAARMFVERLLPMRLPWDHAFDREWFLGLKAAYALPFPASQTDQDFRSSIQSGGQRRLLTRQRWFATYPYQAVNESARWLARSAHFLAWKFAGR